MTASRSPAPPAAGGQPRIRVFVIHHRNSELLDHCLRAVLASSGVDIDVVLFENECREALPAWIQDEARIHRTSSPVTLGFGEANNRAVAWSRTHLPAAEAYFFLNNDAVVRPDTLAKLAEVLEEHPDAAASGPLILIWGAADHLNSLGLNLSTAGEAWDEGIGLPLASHLPLPGREEILAVTGSALLARRSAYEAAGGWSRLFDFYMEDLDLCLRFRRRGQSVWLVPDAVVLHAVSATAGPASEFKLFLFWRNRWILMLLHWPWWRLFRMLPGQFRIERAAYRHRRAAGDLATADRQRRAWLGALALLPKILVARLRHGADTAWWKLLKPSGSVPIITLPEVVTRGRPWESGSTGDAPQ
ncbi:MAG: glycosyltransferase family 2 protein [Thermoanaerobaculia bacterium]|nr:glycosyltransferase family 2 protein [Thermoanaerobaculia bacterium]